MSAASICRSTSKANVKKKREELDFPARCNSTSDMLERLLKNQELPVSTLALLGYKDQLEEPERIKLVCAVKALSLFNNVTREIYAEANVPFSKNDRFAPGC